VKGALGVGERVAKLGVLELRPSEAVLVEAGRVLEPRAFSRQSAIRAGEALRIQNADGFFQDRAGHFDGSDEIGVSCDDDGRLVAVLKTIEEEVCSEIHIGAFFLGFEDLDGIGRGIHHGHSNDAFAEFAKDDFEVWKRVKGAPIEKLPRGLMGVAGKFGHLRSEELCLENGVAGEGTGREFNWVEPSQRSSLHGTVIKIEPIDIEEGFHGRNFRLRKGEEKLPRKNAGAAPEGTAPRPAVETNGRDMSTN